MYEPFGPQRACQYRRFQSAYSPRHLLKMPNTHRKKTNVPPSPVGRETRCSEMHRRSAHPGLSYVNLHIQTHHVLVLYTLYLNARACGMKITG